MAPNCTSAILYEATTGTVLFEKEADLQLPPASMTKVMTAILVLEENPELVGEFTVDKRAVSRYYCSYMIPQKHLLEGEVVSYEDCMKLMLIPSANEAANAFAFDRCDEYSQFIQLMNDKAIELGCENTHFVDASGLSSYNHYTTARDMVTMCEYAMQFDKFREIVSMVGGELPASNVREKGFSYETCNQLLVNDPRYNSKYSPYIIGVKTGFTNAAGWCIAACMEKDGLVYYSVTMNGAELPYNESYNIQGDHYDTVNMYQLTDGLTPENINKIYPKPLPVALIVGVAVAAAAAVVVIVVLKKRKGAARDEA